MIALHILGRRVHVDIPGETDGCCLYLTHLLLYSTLRSDLLPLRRLQYSVLCAWW